MYDDVIYKGRFILMRERGRQRGKGQAACSGSATAKKPLKQSKRKYQQGS
jgi:hypothetical protein